MRTGLDTLCDGYNQGMEIDTNNSVETMQLYSLPALCSMLGVLPKSLRRLAKRAGVSPVCSINDIEHYTADDAELIEQLRDEGPRPVAASNDPDPEPDTVALSLDSHARVST